MEDVWCHNLSMTLEFRQMFARRGYQLLFELYGVSIAIAPNTSKFRGVLTFKFAVVFNAGSTDALLPLTSGEACTMRSPPGASVLSKLHCFSDTACIFLESSS